MAVRPVVGFLLGLVLLAATLGASAAAAQGLPVCSWPIETTGTGPSNIAYPDTNATYWTMPFDASRWQALIIKGTYPEARFMSFVTYDAKEAVVDSLVDSPSSPIATARTRSGRAGRATGAHRGIPLGRRTPSRSAETGRRQKAAITWV